MKQRDRNNWNEGLAKTEVDTTKPFERDEIRKKLGQSGNDYLLFVYGFNVTDDEKMTWPSTISKRLWWQGFKGRLGIFKWPCVVVLDWKNLAHLPTNIYDNSDCKAHNQGKNLADLLAYLDDGYCHGKVHILAHSQGNIVTGEGLRILSGHTVCTYIATQAAVSISNYEPVSVPYFEEPDYGKLGNDHSTPDVRAKFPGCKNPAPYFSPVVTGNRVRKRCNFFNAEDYALRSCDGLSWEDDNQMRPNATYTYSGDIDFYTDDGKSPLRLFRRFGTIRLNFPDKPETEDTFRWNDMKDTFEILSYAAEAWGKPLGIVPAVAGFTGNQDLQSLLGYDRYHYSHSRQFRSNIIAEKEYWKAVLTACNLIERN